MLQVQLSILQNKDWVNSDWCFLQFQKEKKVFFLEREEEAKVESPICIWIVHFFKQRFVTTIWAENFPRHERCWGSFRRLFLYSAEHGNSALKDMASSVHKTKDP